MVGVYAVAGLVGRDAGRVGELFEGLFELASVLLMLCLFGSTVAVVVAAWIYMGWWARLAFLPCRCSWAGQWLAPGSTTCWSSRRSTAGRSVGPRKLAAGWRG